MPYKDPDQRHACNRAHMRRVREGGLTPWEAPEKVAARKAERDGRGWRLRTYEEQKAWTTEKGKVEPEEDLHGVDRPGRWAVRSGRIYLAKEKVEMGLIPKGLEAMLKEQEGEA